jgi:hypothetical protein
MKNGKWFLCVWILASISILSIAQVMRVPQNKSEGDTVYYIPEQDKIYHTEGCPILENKMPFASNIWTLNRRGFSPCEKCLYKEIIVMSMKAEGKIGVEAIGKAEIKSDDSLRLIKKWEGSAQKNTETFEIKTQEWIVRWSTSGTSNFSITVHNADTGRMVDLIANIIGSGQDYSVMRGKGNYYLEISTSQPYIIEIIEKIK